MKQFPSVMLPGICLLCGLLYLPAVWYEFTFDDFSQITDNQLVTAKRLSFGSVVAPFRVATRPGDLYRPIVTLSYHINYVLFGPSPASFHAINILLHLCCCLLAYVTVRRLLPSVYQALAATFLFSLHPIHIEVVAGVVGRAELLAALFGLAALNLCYLGAGDQRGWKRWLCLIAGTFCFLVAGFSKESALTLVLLIPLYLFYLRATARQTWPVATKILLLLAALGILAARYAVLGEQFMSVQDASLFHPENPLKFDTTLLERLIPSLVLLGEYLRLFVVPYPLVADYSFGHSYFWQSIYSPEGCLYACLTLVFCAYIWLRRGYRDAYWGLWFVVGFALTANLVTPIGTFKAERLAYMPSLGFCALVAFAGGSLVSRGDLSRRVALGALAALGIIYGLVTVQRLPVWRDNRTLFTTTVRDSPQNPKAHILAGMYWFLEDKDYEAAGRHFRRALELEPSLTQAAVYMIDVSMKLEEFGRAEYWCRKVLSMDEDNAYAKKYLAVVLSRKEEPQRRCLGRKLFPPIPPLSGSYE